MTPSTVHTWAGELAFGLAVPAGWLALVRRLDGRLSRHPGPAAVPMSVVVAWLIADPRWLVESHGFPILLAVAAPVLLQRGAGQPAVSCARTHSPA